MSHETNRDRIMHGQSVLLDRLGLTRVAPEDPIVAAFTVPPEHLGVFYQQRNDPAGGSESMRIVVMLPTVVAGSDHFVLALLLSADDVDRWRRLGRSESADAPLSRGAVSDRIHRIRDERMRAIETK